LRQLPFSSRFVDSPDKRGNGCERGADHAQRANILEKLGMHDRVELARYAIRRGLIEP